VGESQRLFQGRARSHAPDEKIRAQWIDLPQARQTFAVLGQQSARLWGFNHGVNEHGVAIGHVSHRSRLANTRAGLTATDLVRLGLERARTARQAVDVIAELVERYGQGAFPDCPPEAAQDASLLIADAQEAFALECAGRYWVLQEVQEVRAASNLALIRQDWNRIAPGLSSHAIGQGWWPGDGSKLDFAAAVSDNPVGEASALRRWGRLTLLLQEQSGHIDTAFLRRILSDHYEGMHSEVDPLRPDGRPTPICQHPTRAGGQATAASCVIELGGQADDPSIAWCAFGPPCSSVYFPLLLDGELPAPLTDFQVESGVESLWRRVWRLSERLRQGPELWGQVHSSFSILQARIDQETDEFLEEMRTLRQRDELTSLHRLASFFMQHHLEQFEAVVDSLTQPEHRASPSGIRRLLDSLAVPKG
jgi:dipeptidase